MSTARQNILTKIKTVLEATTDGSGATIFKNVSLTRISPVDLETTPLPACFVYSDRETRLEDEKAVIGKETWEWYVILEIWAIDKDMEDILNEVHTDMFTNYNLGGYAEYSERMGVDFVVVDPTRQVESMAVPYRIIYRHSQGVM